MTDLLARIGDHAAEYRDPLAAVDWHAADPALPWLPRSLLSLNGLAEGEEMSSAAVTRFSRIEFARLCAAGMWLEGLLINRVSAGGFLDLRSDEARVALQEIREESGHSLMFLEMIQRAGVADVALLGDTGLLSWVARRLKPSGAEFWAMVYIGETVTDAFALRVLKAVRAGHADICPVARQVLELHHRDEARHIAASRVFLSNRLERMTQPRHMMFARTLRFLLGRFLDATLFPTPASLAAAGFSEPSALAKRARACPDRRRLAAACARPALDLLAASGVLRTPTISTEEAAP